MLICRRLYIRCLYRRISIHLMLMLILTSCRNAYSLLNFNTSHVNVNQAALQVVRVINCYFNTSHVNVNLYGKYIQGGNTAISIHLMLMLIFFVILAYQIIILISIHLMLMLIAMHSDIFKRDRNFNTSHVNVNLCCSVWYSWIIAISIHLMLMLIHFLHHCHVHFNWISIHLMLMLIRQQRNRKQPYSNFNTSHVNVNLTSLASASTSRLFQYISC